MKRRGFNIVEYSAVIFILVMIAIIAVPKLTAIQRSQQAVGFRLDLTNVALAARAYAIEFQTATRMSFDDNNNLIWSVIDGETSADGTALSGEEVDQRQARRTVTVPEDAQFVIFRRYRQDTTQSDWRCDFYPTGSSDRASLEFEQTGRPFNFTIDPDRGLPTVKEGRLDDQPVERWDAGDIEVRG